MRILAISDDWTHLIDRHGKQHVVQRGCMYPPGVAAPGPVDHPDLDSLSVSHWPCSNGRRWCPGCRLFAWSRKQTPGVDRDALTGMAWSLLASNLVTPGDLP